ncbi:hypothetical protein [uncultured Tenacibaculum sp.]|uniref:hypothetical protein n=1 Tax=uncultured Tenacibaculum sp. TaxID=174713 RepID=UPI002614C7E3|nr:hypothetical protein [uncultured Tenacibaculum sp.]
MKIYIINLTLLILLNFNVSAQTKASNNNKIHKSYITTFGTPKLIKNTTTFYNKKGTEIKQSTISFSKNLDTIIEKRFKDFKLQAQLVFIFNRNRNLIYRSFKNKVPLVGWQFKSTKYKFDKTGLISRETRGKNGNLIDFDVIENDSLKNKISLKTYNSYGELIGYEKTKYNYKENTKKWSVYNRSGKKTTEKTSYIYNEKKSLNDYNKFGDNIFYPRNWYTNDNTYYQIEIKYDKLGNWIEKKTYEVKKINGVFKNKKKYRKNKRKIKYQK